MKLEDVEVPGEHEARERAWTVVQAAFAQLEPQPQPRSWKPIAAVAVALVALAGLLSPPGRAVLDDIREAVGVERSAPALFSLPAPGRLLVTADSGTWVVEQDGSRRRLGDYREASWSPFGRFVVASRQNELVALTPDGDVRWSLARPDVRFPTWHGTQTHTRIAYLTRSRLHVVAGDGTNDLDAGGLPAAAAVAPAWWQGVRPALAYADTRGRVTVYAADTGSVLFRTGRLAQPRILEWSSRGRLLIVTREGLELWGAQGQRLARRQLRGIATASFAPDGESIAVVSRSEILLLDSRKLWPERRIFVGAGLEGLAWSPDGRWLAAGWPDADQLVFVRTAGGRQIRAASNVSAQFRSRSFPTISGWCCAP